MVYLATTTGTDAVFMFDATDGRQIGAPAPHLPGGFEVASVLVDRRSVYFGTDDSPLYSFATDTLQVHWALSMNDDNVHVRATTTPTVDGSMLYVGASTALGGVSPATIYAFDLSSGQPAVGWTFDIPASAGKKVFSRPVVANGHIYFGFMGHIYALDRSGSNLCPRLCWDFAFGNSSIVAAAVAVGPDGVVYAHAGDGNIYAIDQTGKPLWAVATGASAFHIQSSPVVLNGTVYVGAEDGSVYGLDGATGAKTWEFHTADAIHSSPTLDQGVLYIGSDDHSVYALDINIRHGDKALLWSYETGGDVVSTPAVDNGNVYVASADGGLYDVAADLRQPREGKLVWRNFTLKPLYGALLSSPALGP
jgi:eukaryotic-like serine/threonine-protein kinase